jgi:hypothetical protein
MIDKKDDGIIKRAFITHTDRYLDVFPKREIWREIAKDFNGTFKIGHTSSNVLEILRIYIPYKNWEIKLSESDTRPLKFEIDFIPKIDYDLTIGLEDTIERIIKRFGKGEIELGYKDFDEHYIIKGKNPGKTIQLFTHEIIVGFLKYNVYSFAYSINKKKQTSQLISVISRVVDDKDTLVNLILLHQRIVDRLEDLSIITDTA